MSKLFAEGNYTEVPNYVSKQVRTVKDQIVQTSWHTNIANLTQEQIKRDIQTINNHRYRQRTFVAECYQQLKNENRTWVAHIDTDEYITVNPLLIEAEKHAKDPE